MPQEDAQVLRREQASPVAGRPPAGPQHANLAHLPEAPRQWLRRWARFTLSAAHTKPLLRTAYKRSGLGIPIALGGLGSLYRRKESRMSEAAKNRELIQNIMRQFATTGSAAALLDNITEDAILELSVPEGTPLSGRFQGREGFLEYFKRVEASVEASDIVMSDYLAESDKVVVLGHEKLRVKRTGTAWHTRYAVVYTFRGGRIAHMDMIEDMSPYAAAYR
jgi:ketosteroid isomerase-like protein